MKIIEQEPTNISELKEKANTKDNWKVRLEAVNEMAQYDSQKSRHILTELVKNDRVFAVKEAAFKAAQAMGITEKGQPLELKRKGLGYSGKTYTKIFSRVKNETEMEAFDLDTFKKQFQVVSPEMYDVMAYDKQDQFDAWIEETYNKLV